MILILDSIRNDRKEAALQLLRTFNSVDLHRLLVANWPILFETTKVKRTGKSLTTFSELTESYLLPASINSNSIRSALLATFRNLLIDTNVLNIELILKLLMDFLASHFGQISLYMSVQSILENLLEAYFHRLYVIRRYSDTLSSASQDVLTKNAADHSKSGGGNNNDSLASTSSENVTASIGANSATSGQRMNDSTQSEMKESLTQNTNGMNDSTARKHSHNLFSSSFNVEALKILTRIYFSSLKSMAVDFDAKTKEKTVFTKYVKFLRENLNRVYAHHVAQSANCGGKNSIIDETKFHTDGGGQSNANNDDKNRQHEIQLTKIPILFFAQRPSFLDSMPPIVDFDASGKCISNCSANNGEIEGNNEKRRKAIVVVLKLQVRSGLSHFIADFFGNLFGLIF